MQNYKNNLIASSEINAGRSNVLFLPAFPNISCPEPCFLQVICVLHGTEARPRPLKPWMPFGAVLKNSPLARPPLKLDHDQPMIPFGAVLKNSPLRSLLKLPSRPLKPMIPFRAVLTKLVAARTSEAPPRQSAPGFKIDFGAKLPCAGPCARGIFERLCVWGTLAPQGRDNRLWPSKSTSKPNYLVPDLVPVAYLRTCAFGELLPPGPAPLAPTQPASQADRQ